MLRAEEDEQSETLLECLEERRAELNAGLPLRSDLDRRLAC